MTSKIIPLSYVLLNLESGKEGKESQKFKYLESKKSFLDEMKNIFDSFYRAII